MPHTLITIGRDEKSDFRIEEPTVSRRHAEMVISENGEILLSDCVSAHGTSVQRADKWISIRQGSVTNGEVVKFASYEVPVQIVIDTVLAPVADDVQESLQGAVKRNIGTGEVVSTQGE